jgi:crotonobetainyl-CoA:carnitine CoA-transferase CaiB-like acyl-CoA transferase
VASADVVVENFRPGVMQRLGVGFDELRREHPRLVYCAISGFGETGPLSKAGCADPIMQAFSGFARANGAPGDPVEAFRFTGFLDLTTASVATMSILAALLDRSRSGLGQKVEVSMLEAALEIQGTRIAELLGAGLRPGPMGSANPSFAPDRAYATLDHELFVSVQRPSAWPAFCKAIGQEALATDPRFMDNAARVAHRDALDALLEPVLLSRPAIWWLRVLQRAGALPQREADHQRAVLNGRLTMLIDPVRLGTQALFEQEALAFADWLRQSPDAPGSDGVKLAGEPERAAREDREQNGIWIDGATWAEIEASEQKLQQR